MVLGTMTVYFIRVGKDGPVKIGYAADAAIRLQQLQVCHPETLHLIRTIDGGSKGEAWLHDRFYHHRIRGEWFNFCPEMMEVEPPLFETVTPTAVSELIDAFGGPTEFSKVIGLKNPSTASEMKRSGSIRTRYWPAIIAAAPDYGIDGIDSDRLMRMHCDDEQVAA